MYDITVGDEYWISKLNGEQWEDMPTNIVWNDLGIQIRAGSYHEFNCNLNLVYQGLFCRWIVFLR